MRPLIVAACLLLIATIPASAQTSPSSGLYMGDIAHGETEHRSYDTHGDQPCLAIYIPHTYTITLETDPAATVQVQVATHSATTSNGLATFSFTANYCNAFTVTVRGLDVPASEAYGDAAPYVLTVTHILQGPGAAIA